MNMRKIIRIQKLQNKNKMTGQTFNVLGINERHENPWLGGVWFENGMDKERAEYIKTYKEETKRMLSNNPKLKLV